MEEALTFDDVLLIPQYSNVLPLEVQMKTRLTANITLNIPIISAAMDTVTEVSMSIAMAQLGGIGVIHKSMSIDKQVKMVYQVKRFESGVVLEPTVLYGHQCLREALQIMKEVGISGAPVVNEKTKILEGILTNRDMRFVDNFDVLVKDVMTSKKLIVLQEGESLSEGRNLLRKHRIEKIIIVNKKNQCVGLLTAKDIEKELFFPTASKDAQGRLRVAAAVGVTSQCMDRAKALIENQVDVLVVDTAHGHSESVIRMVKAIKSWKNTVDVIAGNIATGEAVKDLVEAGVDALKVGIGPGSICTTRVVAGVGVPQFTAILNVVREAKKYNIPVIADGGLRYSGDIAKALAAGASSAMIGSLLAGTDEAPGDVVLYQGRSYKLYRGMGSIGAMREGSADRYFQANEEGMSYKFVPEGIEGRVPYKGSVSQMIYQLVGGISSAMGYVGASDLLKFQEKAKFCRITASGQRESHVHDVQIVKEAPNYRL